MKSILFSFLIFIVFLTGDSYASNFGMGVHWGYGVLTYEEESAAFGTGVTSDFRMKTMLFGVSGEYSFKRLDHFFIAFVTDWVVGVEDRENWNFDNAPVQTGDMNIGGQFYDARIGYKNGGERYYYRVHLSGGWDGLSFERDRYIWRGIPITGNTREDISLWRVGAGTGMGYRLGTWSLDSRIAYSYHIRGRVENSALPGVTFKTNGTCLDGGIGLARQLGPRTGLYFGISYSLFKLRESDRELSGNTAVIYPESETEMKIGVFNLTHSF